jgi:O-antigen ligase
VLFLSFLRYRPRFALLVVGATIVLLVAGSVSGSYSSRLETLTQALPWHSDSKSGDPSIQGRAIFLHAGYHMWRDHPLGGVGYANFGESYHEYNREVGADPTLGSSAHNTPLEVLTETGVIGLALWAVLVLSALASLWRVRAWAGPERRDVSLTADYLAIAVAGYLVTSLFLGGAYSIHAWLLLAICFSVRGALGDGKRPLRERLRVPGPAR